MRILAAITVGCGLLCVSASPALAQRYSQSQTKVPASAFPLVVHVTGSHFSPEAKGVLFVDAAIQGEQVRMATSVLSGLLPEGDYKGRVASEHKDKNGSFSKSYELLFADGSHHVFNVIGTSE